MKLRLVRSQKPRTLLRKQLRTLAQIAVEALLRNDHLEYQRIMVRVEDSVRRAR